MLTSERHQYLLVTVIYVRDVSDVYVCKTQTPCIYVCTYVYTSLLLTVSIYFVYHVLKFGFCGILA